MMSKKKKKNIKVKYIEVFSYFTCDKPDCRKQNIRKLLKYDRGNNYCPIANTDDVCDYCGAYIHEPSYVDMNPYQENIKSDDRTKEREH